MSPTHGSGEPQESVVRQAARPPSPGRFDTRAWKATLRRTQARVKEDRVTMAAGSLAYHWFLAMFPAIIAALGVLTMVHVSTGTLQHLTHGLSKAFPAGAAGVFNGAVQAATRRSSGSVIAAVVGVVVALWSASSGTAVLQQALDVTYQVRSDRKFLSRRLWGLPMMAAVAVLGGLGAALIVFGQPIGSAIDGAVPFGGAAFTIVWTVVRWVVGAALLSLAFSAVYYLGPNRKNPRWQWVSVGGIVATAVFLVASLGFSFYVSSFGSYGKTYGSFAGVAILIFWLWLIGLAVLVGAELNAEIERESAAQTASPTEEGTTPVTVDENRQPQRAAS